MADNKDKLKILIVDDSKIDLDILESILMQIGFQDIIKSVSGKEALQLAKKHRPDLIISDILMPGLDGGIFRGLLKESQITCDIPVIFISSIIDLQEETAYGGQLKSGDVLISKPYSKDRISKAINIAIKRKIEK